MATKPIVVQVTKATDGWVKGAELGFDSEAKATSALGDGTFKVLRHQDGSAVEAPQSRQDAPEPAKDGKRG